MSSDVELTLRGPAAYDLAGRAVEAMRAAGVWPTPVNFELWLHYLANPTGELAKALEVMLAAGPLTEEGSQMLAARHLVRMKLSEEIRDAGEQLSRELTSVAGAIAEARKVQVLYGETLAEAGRDIETNAEDPAELARAVRTLSKATDDVRRENATLEVRLADSTREVVKLREHLEEVRRDSLTDALTKLANRKAFDDRLERAIAERNGALAVALLDVDHFKRFNDTYGHQTGDQVLRYVASVIDRAATAPRFAARYGGEEFAIVLPGETPAEVEAALDGVRQEIASRQLKRRSTNEDLGAVTISIGVAHWRPNDNASSILERADGALYASKRSGRNRLTGDGMTAAA